MSNLVPDAALSGSTTSDISPPLAATSTSASAAEKLRFGTILAYGAPNFFGAAMGLIVAVFLGKFYVDTVLMPAGILALAIAAGRACDAMIDPFVGYLSDHTRSRWGRRRPYIFFGVLGNAVAFYMMLTPPESLKGSSAIIWFMTTFVLSFLSVSASHIPRTALGVELTLDTVERHRLFGVMSGFVAVGTILGSITPTVLQGFGLIDVRSQMQATAVIFVAGYVAFNMLLLAVVPERREFIGRGEVPFVPGARRALRNRAFRIMFISHVITAIPMAIPAVLMPFFTQYVLQLDGFRWTGIFVLAYLAAGFLMLPGWMWISRRFGKLAVWLIASFIGVTGGAGMYFMPPGEAGAMLALEIYVGLQSSVWIFVGTAMHADVVDYDELQTGKRREAQFSALWSIIPKFALIPGAALPLAILGAVGYVPNAPFQSVEVQSTLRLLFAVVPALLNAVGLALMWWYPLHERAHLAIREGIARHAAGEDALDPITGQMLPPPQRRSVDEATAWFLDNFSPHELQRSVEQPASALRSVLVRCAAFALVMALAIAFAVSRVESVDINPGPLPALAIVLAGVCLTGLMFHALRIGPARRLQGRPPAPAVIAMHLEALKAATGSTSPTGTAKT